MSADPVRRSEGVGPLAGVKVLDLTRFWSGPAATRTLADYGATVIKVEAPEGGDEGRALGQMSDGFNYMKEYANRGKMSLTLDLRNPASKPVMKKLVEWADILCENFVPGTLDGYGYSYDQCKEWNPMILYCSNSGFGDRGPLAKEGSFDAVVQGFTGAMHSQGGGPSHVPQQLDFGFSDELGAMSYVQGIMLALVSRQTTGKGQRMDTSQTGATIQFTQNLAPILHMDGTQPDRGQPKPGHLGWLANTYQAKDGKWLVLQVKDFFNFLRVIGREDMTKDERLQKLRDRTKNQEYVIGEVQKAFQTQDREYWLKFLHEAGEPCAPVHNYKELMEHDQVWANNYLAKIEGDALKKVPGAKATGEVVMGKPFSFSKTPAGPVAVGAEVGEHNEEVLKNILKVPQAEIDALEKAKAIKSKL